MLFTKHLTVAGVVLVSLLVLHEQRQAPAPASRSGVIAVATHTSSGRVALPARLVIRRIGVDAPIIPVGITAEGAMDAPARADEVGWFAPGTVPGESGSAVLAGHLDTVAGSAGIFGKIDTLLPGDAITVVDANGRTEHFHVVSIEEYPEATLPMERIFRSQTGSHLNLITCHGWWQASKQTYNRRLVVFADKSRE